MYAANGENRPARESPPSPSSVAAWKVVTSSHTNMPAITIHRTTVARRRSATHAPTVYIAMNTATLPT